MFILQATLVASCALAPSVAECTGDTCALPREEVQRESVLLQTHGLLHSKLALNASQTQPDFGGEIDNCRFASNPDWATELIDNEDAQDAYVSAVLKWDGKFVTAGVGMTESGLTKDHINLDESGEMTSSGWYTAPSKESLHMSMLALVVDQTPLAYHWLGDTQEEAEAEAIRRLGLIIEQYEGWRETCPACAGFIPWLGVDDNGFKTPKKYKLPALDNGQMAWAMIAIVQALTDAQDRIPEAAGLIERYQTHVDTMKESAVTIFMHPKGKCHSMSKAKNPNGPREVSNYKKKGGMNDPFEGELMLLFIDLLTEGDNRPSAEQHKKLWKKYNNANQKATWTSEDGSVGPITIQKGWRFSAHEAWKYLALPYFDVNTVQRLFKNQERVRTWDAHLNNVPGMKASCYGTNPWYVDRLGVEDVSFGFDENVRETDKMVTPYGAFPLIMTERGQGLAWHRAMLARPKMQCPYGSTEASQQTNDNPGVAMKCTWDTKVTTDVALVGGTGNLIRRYLQREDVDKYDAFVDRISTNHQKYEDLQGEDVELAPPPTQLGESDDRDFSSCARA